MKEGRRPRRGPMASPEKAKDFKKSILRLLKELNPFKFIITLAMILAILGAILSILAPNRLSKLTDEISKGLVINTKNMEKISTTITNTMQDEKTMAKIQAFITIIPSTKSEDLMKAIVNLSPNI